MKIDLTKDEAVTVMSALQRYEFYMKEGIHPPTPDSVVPKHKLNEYERVSGHIQSVSEKLWPFKDVD